MGLRGCGLPTDYVRPFDRLRASFRQTPGDLSTDAARTWAPRLVASPYHDRKVPVSKVGVSEFSHLALGVSRAQAKRPGCASDLYADELKEHGVLSQVPA